MRRILRYMYNGKLIKIPYESDKKATELEMTEIINNRDRCCRTCGKPSGQKDWCNKVCFDKETENFNRKIATKQIKPIGEFTLPNETGGEDSYKVYE